jgi:hypothetical protein
MNLIEKDKNSNSTINSNFKSAKTNSGLKYPMKNSTLKLGSMDFELFKVESSRADFGLKSTHQDSILEFVRADFGIEIIMINYIFIQNQRTDVGRTKIHMYFQNNLYNQC